jgi:ribosome-associated protein
VTADHDDGEDETPRQLARQRRRLAGDRSSRMAHALMQLPEAALRGLGLDGDLREAVDRARAVTSHVARRREERRLAGVLRQVDADDLETRLSNLQQGSRADARQYQLAESWRARLIEEDAPAAEAFLARFARTDRAALAKLVEEARRERATGRPRGAGRALFRLVIAALRAADDDPRRGNPFPVP